MFWKVLKLYNAAVETFLLTTSKYKVRRPRGRGPRASPRSARPAPRTPVQGCGSGFGGDSLGGEGKSGRWGTATMALYIVYTIESRLRGGGLG